MGATTVTIFVSRASLKPASSLSIIARGAAHVAERFRALSKRSGRRLAWQRSGLLRRCCERRLEVEIETARLQGKIAGAVETASEEDRQRGQKAVIAKDRQLVCP
ncbi:MAG: hypothetical protein FD164_218 [Nitrospirae bacterium]|nr:MAG: hypothetical protein FD164_218 [Nitrospirota bacterium]